MTLERNKRIVSQFFDEFLIGHNVKILDECLRPNYIQHNPLIADGKQGLILFFQEYWEKYNPTYDVKRILAEKDLVAIHYHYKRNAGEKGMAIVDIFRLENGKLVEHWDVVQPLPQKSENDHPLF